MDPRDEPEQVFDDDDDTENVDKQEQAVGSSGSDSESVELMLGGDEDEEAGSGEETEQSIKIATAGANKYVRKANAETNTNDESNAQDQGTGETMVQAILNRLPAVPRAPADLPEFPKVFDIDMDSIAEKPWTRPGVDMTDWFNYGFDEEMWREYCYRQIHLRLNGPRSKGSRGGQTPPAMLGMHMGMDPRGRMPLPPMSFPGGAGGSRLPLPRMPPPHMQGYPGPAPLPMGNEPPPRESDRRRRSSRSPPRRSHERRSRDDDRASRHRERRPTHSRERPSKRRR